MLLKALHEKNLCVIPKIILTNKHTVRIVACGTYNYHCALSGYYKGYDQRCSS